MQYHYTSFQGKRCEDCGKQLEKGAWQSNPFHDPESFMPGVTLWFFVTCRHCDLKSSIIKKNVYDGATDIKEELEVLYNELYGRKIKSRKQLNVLQWINEIVSNRRKLRH